MDLVRVAPLLVGTGVTLGLGAPIAKAASQHGVAALAFALWPTLAAGLVLGLLGLLRQGRPADLTRVLRFGGVAGLFGHALPMSALFWLSAHAGAGFASLSLALPPVFTLLISLALGLERVAATRVAAVALGLSGALVMLVEPGGSLQASAPALAAAVFIPASIGAANVYRSRRMPAGVGGEWLSSATLLASSAALVVVGGALGLLMPPPDAVALMWLGAQAGALVVGYLLYFALQRRSDAVTFSFIGYVMMLTGVGIGTVFFGEELSWRVLPAAALVLAALMLLQRPAPVRHPAARRVSQGTAA